MSKGFGAEAGEQVKHTWPEAKEALLKVQKTLDKYSQFDKDNRNYCPICGHIPGLTVEIVDDAIASSLTNFAEEIKKELSKTRGHYLSRIVSRQIDEVLKQALEGKNETN